LSLPDMGVDVAEFAENAPAVDLDRPRGSRPAHTRLCSSARCRQLSGPVTESHRSACRRNGKHGVIEQSNFVHSAAYRVWPLTWSASAKLVPPSHSSPVTWSRSQSQHFRRPPAARICSDAVRAARKSSRRCERSVQAVVRSECRLKRVQSTRGQIRRRRQIEHNSLSRNCSIWSRM